MPQFSVKGLLFSTALVATILAVFCAAIGNGPRWAILMPVAIWYCLVAFESYRERNR